MLDIDTADRAVHLSDRPVVALSPGLVDALTGCRQTGRTLMLMTPPTSRVTFPLRLLVLSGAVRWLIRTASGELFEALSGAPVASLDAAPYDDESAQPPHPEWGSTSGTATQHGADDQTVHYLCSMTIDHRATAGLRLDAAAALCRATTGREPLGWGTAEPLAQSWNADSATAFARRRVPAPTTLIVGGDGFIATSETLRTGTGVREDVTALIAGQPGLIDATTVRDALADVGGSRPVTFALAQHRVGSQDLTSPARAQPAPTPIAVLLGARACRRVGVERLEQVPVGPAQRVGHERAPALLWPISGDFDQAWAQLETLVEASGIRQLEDWRADSEHA